MTDKKQLHKQAIVFSVILILSWMMLAGLQAMLPAVIMIVITVFLNYCFLRVYALRKLEISGEYFAAKMGAIKDRNGKDPT